MMAFGTSIEHSLTFSTETFSNSGKQIAAYMREHLDSVSTLSIQELSARIGTSEATVNRFCKTLGFKGYRDFIIALSKELGSRKTDDPALKYADIKPGDDVRKIIDNVCLVNMQSIADTKSILDSQSVESAVSLIRAAERIFFFGIGASGLVALDGQQKFMRINKKAWALTDSHEIRQNASILCEKDVAIFLSYSGTTKEIVSAFNTAMKMKASTIVMSKLRKKGIAKSADVSLCISSPELTIRSGAMGSRIAMLNCIDIIFTAVASAEYDTVRNYLDLTHDAIQHF